MFERPTECKAQYDETVTRSQRCTQRRPGNSRRVTLENAQHFRDQRGFSRISRSGTHDYEYAVPAPNYAVGIDTMSLVLLYW